MDKSKFECVPKAEETGGSLGKDLSEHWANPTFTDWTLICEDVEIPCHRFMLGSRSPVFQKMFEQNGFDEIKTHQTKIQVSVALNIFKVAPQELPYNGYSTVVAEWAKTLPQIQVEAHYRSQVQIPLGVTLMVKF